MIEVSGLTKHYGPIAAIEDVTFSMEKGEILGLLGPNAAGKTTTMRILAGFSPATRGTAKVAGFDVAEQPIEVKRRVGYLPENVPLYPEMRVCRFLSYVAEVKRRLSRSERRAEVGRVIERCGLRTVQDRVIRNLSKGFRQRVGLAQALIGAPPVLILDEPTIGLDPKQIIEIRQMIKNLAEEHTVLLSTHILPEATMLCNRVVIIHRGRVVAKDSVSNLAAAGSERALLEVQAAGDRDGVRAALARVPGVEKVYEERPGRYLVVTSAKHLDAGLGSPSGRDVRESLAKAIIEAGYALHGLQQRSRTLEDIFVDAISSDEGTGA